MSHIYVVKTNGDPLVDLKLQLWFYYYASHFFCYHCFICLSRHKAQISAGITFKVRETERKRGSERGRKRGRRREGGRGSN